MEKHPREPLRTREGFVREGIASWYGKDFHGKMTSHGEIYDMHTMNAAHKRLLRLKIKRARS